MPTITRAMGEISTEKPTVKDFIDGLFRLPVGFEHRDWNEIVSHASLESMFEFKLRLIYYKHGAEPDYRRDAISLGESFHKELLELIKPEAQNVRLNDTQRHYLTNVIDRNFEIGVTEFEIEGTEKHRSLKSAVNQEEILGVANYINGLA